MKPTSPHDPLDDLFAAALHGELTPEERAQLDAQLQNDPAAHAAYLEALAMHDMLNGSYQNAQPDPAFEQRMVSGVRRKIQHEGHRETVWESLLVLWAFVTKYSRRFEVVGATVFVGMIAVMVTLVVLGSQVKGVFTTISSQLAYAGASGGEDAYYKSVADAAQKKADAGQSEVDADAAPASVTENSPPASTQAPMEPMPQAWTTPQQVLSGAGTISGGTIVSGGRMTLGGGGGTTARPFRE
jgi:hypothetical protein